MIQIKVSKKDFFTQYLLWLNPILNLTTPERKILAALLTLHFAHKHRYQNEDLLFDLMFNQETTKDLSKKLSLSTKKYKQVLDLLIQKDLIHQDGNTKKINPYLTSYPRDNKFKITVDFQISD